jgi:hypothetical protein
MELQIRREPYYYILASAKGVLFLMNANFAVATSMVILDALFEEDGRSTFE